MCVCVCRKENLYLRVKSNIARFFKIAKILLKRRGRGYPAYFPITLVAGDSNMNTVQRVVYRGLTEPEYGGMVA